MANQNIASIGRFSSQMLTYLGTQRTVKSVTGSPANTFKYSTGNNVFPDPGSIEQSALGAGVSGSYPLEWYNNTKCYFMSRGATTMYAQAMTGLVIDMATALSVSPQFLLEQAELSGQLLFSPNAYRTFNMLRDPTHQVGVVTSVSNRDSIKSREIRS